jgi:hypothetical protein
MDDVAELVLTPFREIVEKGKTAVENAGDAQPMLRTSQTLVKEGERALKKIEPLCKKHLEEYGVNFIDALKENGTYKTKATKSIPLFFPSKQFAPGMCRFQTNTMRLSCN